MNNEELSTFVQRHFTDGLVIVIGSGLSAAEGIPGMPELAQHLKNCASTLTREDTKLWGQIEADLVAGDGLEAALLKHPPTSTLETWIAKETCGLLLPREHDVVAAVLRGDRTLRLTTFLNKILKPATGLPILTPNYDRLIEVACEMSGFHVDTTAIGHYAGAFDHVRSCMGSCRGITRRARRTVLDHYPRAIVLKPHGSFDWYRTGNGPRRCSMDLNADRLIITPGLNKYRAGYDAPFDKHRDLANDYIKRATRFLVVGYGFNDDHLQTHLVNKIKSGVPTLILSRSLNLKTKDLIKNLPQCVGLSSRHTSSGVTVTNGGTELKIAGSNLWDLAVLTEELLT